MIGKKTRRLYPYIPLENNNLERRLEKKLGDVNCFINSVNKIKKMVCYFKDENFQSKKQYKNIKC